MNTGTRVDATVIVGMLAAVVGGSTVLVPGMWRLVTVVWAAILCCIALVLAVQRYQRRINGGTRMRVDATVVMGFVTAAVGSFVPVLPTTGAIAVGMSMPVLLGICLVLAIWRYQRLATPALHES